MTGQHHDQHARRPQEPSSEPATPTPVDSERGVYSIAVAAELVGTAVQSLRLYEARGLLRPGRTAGGTRRYSNNDLDRLRRISGLQDEGVNLAGIAMVMDLQDENSELRDNPRSAAHPPTAPTPATRGGVGSDRRPLTDRPQI